MSEEKKILIVDDSPEFQNYLTEKLLDPLFSMTFVENTDAALKALEANKPDVILIHYPIVCGSVFFKFLEDNDVFSDIPVIVFCNRLQSEGIHDLGVLKLKLIILSPLRIEPFWRVMGDLTGFLIKIDHTPCSIQAHLNGGIVFIEVKLGLNFEEIRFLEVKLAELIGLQNLKNPKFFVLFSDILPQNSDRKKLSSLFKLLNKLVKDRDRAIKVMVQNPELGQVLRHIEGLSPEIVAAMLDDSLDEFFFSSEPEEPFSIALLDSNKPQLIQNLSQKLGRNIQSLKLAVVDDDFIVQEILKNTFSILGCSIKSFDDGPSFLKDKSTPWDLVFLDLMMPEMSGFEVMEALKKQAQILPVIILSALSRQETVLKTMNYGIANYISKPLKPNEILRKTFEVVKQR